MPGSILLVVAGWDVAQLLYHQPMRRGQELAAPAIKAHCASRNRRRIFAPAGSSIQRARTPWDTTRTTRNPTLLFLSLLFRLRLDERTSRLSQSLQISSPNRTLHNKIHTHAVTLHGNRVSRNQNKTVPEDITRITRKPIPTSPLTASDQPRKDERTIYCGLYHVPPRTT